MTPSYVTDLFKNNQMSPEVFTMIVKNMHSLAELDKDWVFEFLNQITTTNRFVTTLKFLSRSEKNTIRELITKVSSNDENTGNLFTIYNLTP